MSVQQEILQLEHHLKGLKESKEISEGLNRLLKNRDFRKIILEGFCLNEVARYMAVSTDPDLGPAERADALLFAQSGGVLKRWLNKCAQMAQRDADSIPACEQALEELRAEPDGQQDDEE